MTTTEAAPTTVIGQRRLRREDPALLTGEAKFTNDLAVPGALNLALVRSPYAHARIVSIDTSAAAEAPGVIAVYTGNDLAEHWAAPMPCAWPVTEDMKNPPHYPLAKEKVCYAGDAVAAVLADTEAAAQDAAELVNVEYEPLEAVIDLEDALSDRVVIHEDLGTNKSYTWALKVEAGGRRHRRRLRARRLHGERAVRAATADPDGDRDPGGRRRAPAVRRRHHDLLRHPDPPHPQADDGGHARHPRAPGARRRPVGRRRLRLEAQRLRRGAAVRRPRPQARRAGALERVPRREHAGDDPGPRADPAHRARRRRRRQAHRVAGPTAVRHGRLPAARDPGHPDSSAPSSTPASTTCRRRTTSSAPRCSRR